MFVVQRKVVAVCRWILVAVLSWDLGRYLRLGTLLCRGRSLQ